MRPLPFASLASQKNHMAIYLMSIYSDSEQEQQIRAAWTKTGKKPDTGRSCIRFKKIDDVPLEVIGQTVKRMSVKKYIKQYETVMSALSRKPQRTTTPTKTATKKVRKVAARKKPRRWWLATAASRSTHWKRSCR